MAPFSLANIPIPRSLDLEPITTAGFFAKQWMNPNETFSVLLLLGPEVVQQAVAQLAGRAVTPVAFSFGWVAYSTKAFLAVIGG